LVLAASVLLLAAGAGWLWKLKRQEEAAEPAVEPPPAAAEPLVAPPAAPATVPQPASPEASAVPPAGKPGEAAELADGPWAEAQAAAAAGQWGVARTRAFAALESARDPSLRRRIEDLLGRVHIALAFSPAPMEEKIDYTIRPGDTLAGIAKAHGCTVQLLARGNGIKGDVIRPGDRLRILTGRFAVAVDKSDNELVVTLNDRFFKRYRVGTGKYERTPVGQFRITERIPQPTWWHPDGRVIPYGDKENVLGTHWLSLDVPGYGIHGTWEPQTIGRQESAGCIRLLNEDIEELFVLLPSGTPVTVAD